MEHKSKCTPFNKTGYCKYGNTCKYSHIRLNTCSDTILCPLCNKEILNAVSTNCSHEYCLDCVKLNRDSLEKCVVCQKELYGVFYYKK